MEEDGKMGVSLMQKLLKDAITMVGICAHDLGGINANARTV